MFPINGRTKYTNNTFSEICDSSVSYQHWKKQSTVISTLHLFSSVHKKLLIISLLWILTHPTSCLSRTLAPRTEINFIFTTPMLSFKLFSELFSSSSLHYESVSTLNAGLCHNHLCYPSSQHCSSLC